MSCRRAAYAGACAIIDRMREEEDAGNVQVRLTRHDVVGEPDRVDPEVLGALRVGAERLWARQSEPPKAKADADLDAPHMPCSPRCAIMRERQRCGKPARGPGLIG